VVVAGILWWPSARSTVLKKLISGERDEVAAVGDELEPSKVDVLLDDAVSFR
jgi:hypothetical protein